MTTQPALSPAAWQLAKALYDKVLALPPGECEACIAGEPVDEAIRTEVRSLLAVCPDAAPSNGVGEGFLNQSPHLAGDGMLDRTGERLGPWMLVRPLGTGGMGDVFEVQRADGSYEGRAAIKLLKRGLDSTAVLQRFALERQALARMHHPHIATLLDAGISSDGLPYFVMEYVDGKPIDQAIVGWSVEARLGVFLQLADAVSHAHRQLLVHRDLKPGNVMVGSDGQVKLLDFGIAKALDPLEGSTDHTTLGAQRPFTPNYASPEQVRGEPISTATDIYSLGVLLYQMLTGLRPTGRNATTPAEAARCVLEEEPTRPSRLDAAQVADPQWVSTRKRLQGDLDNILLKALEKQVERRYASVDAFAQDIGLYLGGYPVSAKARSWRYLAAKFWSRHPLGVSLAAAAVAVMGATTGTAIVQARLAMQERENAQQHLDDVRTLAKSMIFDVNDALASGITPGRSALVKTAGEYLSRRINATDLSIEETLDLVGALRRMADIEGNLGIENLGDSKRALTRYAEAIDMLERVPPAKRTDAKWWYEGAATRRSQSLLLRSSDQIKAAVESADAGRTLILGAIARDPSDMKALRLSCNLAIAQADALYSMGGLPSLGQLDEAIAILRQAVDCAEALREKHPDDTSTALVLSSALARLARGSLMAGRLDEGVALARRNDSMLAEILSKEPQNPTFGRFASIARSLLGYALVHAGQPDDGSTILRSGVDTARKQMLLDPNNDRARRDFMSLAWTYGGILIVLERGNQGLEICREARRAMQKSIATQSPDSELLLQDHGLLRCEAEAWLLTGKPEATLEMAEGSSRQLDNELGHVSAEDRHRVLNELGQTTLLKARALQQLGRNTEALSYAGKAMVRMDELLALDPQNTETQADNASARIEAALIEPRAGLTKGGVQCLWAQEADTIFRKLAAQSRLNREMDVPFARAQKLVGRCAKLRS